MGLGNSLQTTQAGGGVVGGWVELGRTTLGSAGDDITVSSLPDKRYYMVLTDLQDTGGSIHAEMRLNGDTGSNYAYRYNNNGGTDVGAGPATVMALNPAVQASEVFSVGYLSNLSSKEKLHINHCVNQYAAGAGTAPHRQESVNKHAQTSNPINSVTIRQGAGSGDYAIGSEAVVLGWDPADTDTSNFWEELASVNGDGTGGFDTGTFTSKKYLCVQAYLDPSASARNNFRVGNTTVDTGNNYSTRSSTDGGADSTETSVTVARGNATSYSTPSFFNMFIINNSANEKLIIGHSVIQNTAGAANAPNRIEFVSKWADTSNQIDIIEAFPSSGNYSTTSQIKVWGAN